MAAKTFFHHRASLALSLKLITPLFGGGYEAGEVDKDCPVRAATIRGHLCFWWRAIYEAQYDSPKALFEAEEEIWAAPTDPVPSLLKWRLLRRVCLFPTLNLKMAIAL
ncbi:type III-B CRISPR module RAMP protein Cmr1 [Chthonomonas calidirosea]|uniref:type III-B CRISPR module RAMP protein Cmr1 n=1 Tax=Chthonomonas calidirosea TaxID=454171 RepID=UPI0006EC8245|nr:type III-B CRISPR module RAMP protein Cmr1 [Chthonomonas calidirosea]CEK16977.1 CRISPR type III-B/RAMP module RAMP protein Cmr1 [Chthonomonas calidirosea]